MNKDEALRLALEALEYASTGNRRPEIIAPAITAIKQALEQPEPEPVPQLGDGIFWYNTCKSVQEHPDHAENDIWCKGQATWIQGPFYTSPPKREWQGLTDEEVQMFIDARWGDGVNFTHFIRAIEAKLKEKNT
jgi:hypothetical protein